MSTISSGSSLYTTFLGSASQTVIEEIVQPTPFTTTIFSGTSFYTSSTILPDGQEEVEFIEPATTTTTIVSGSSFYTSSTMLPDGQVENQVIEPATTTITIVSGSSFYTSTTVLPNGQTLVGVNEPATTTTTIVSGSSFYTSTTVLPDGQTVVGIVEPATTTTTSYTATTTIFTATNTGVNGQVTVSVVEPTPGMQYFGFQDPSDSLRSTKPDASRFNNNASQIDVRGVFPGDINFYTDGSGYYQFPGQTTQTNAANYVVVLEGYFYGPPGDYAVTMSTQTDDYSFLWMDSSAYSGWTDNDAYITESIAGGYTQNHTFTLTAGEFVPLTIMWFNVFESGGVRFWIYPPGGGVVTDTTGWFVQPYAGDAFEYHV